MEIYNRYVKHPHNAEIAVIASSSSSKRVFYVEFHDGKQGFYLDKDNCLFGLQRGLQGSLFNKLNTQHEIVKNINSVVRNYVFIKVIKDKQNPQLEGETMIFYFGKKILDILKGSGNYLQSKVFKKSFIIDTKLIGGFPNYDNSHYTDNDVSFKEDLDIEQYINIPVLDLETMVKQKRRKEKLEHIQKQTNLKDNIISILEQKKDSETTADEIINIIIDI